MNNLNHCILKEISPWYSLEGLMLKLKLQYFGYLMLRVDSLEKTLILGGIGGRRRRRGWQPFRDSWMASLTRWTWVWVNSGCWWWTGDSWGCKELDITEWLNWIIRWHHTNGWKALGTKKPSDEGERGEWKSCIKTQYKNKQTKNKHKK